MGQYKVPQNVESEDKIIGALTLKQFIYTVVGVMIGVASFLILRKAPVVMLIVGLPPTALFLMLGLYQRQDQPFEALFLSLVSFTAKPRRRLWIKEPIEEVFKIEAPKVVKTVTQRDPHEVRGQLEQLSQVVDTRGWGNKAAELQEPSGNEAGLESEGRLVMPDLATTDDPGGGDISVADDILDIQNNPNLDRLIQDQSKNIRAEAVAKLKSTTPASATAAPITQPATPQPQGITSIGSSNLVTDQPLPGSVTQPSAPSSAATTQTAPANPSTTGMTVNPLDGILKLAMESQDLPVSQVAAQANRQQALAEGQSVSLRNNGNSS